MRQQLQPLDAVFLATETPETPGHIGGLSVLAPPADRRFDYESFLDFIAERLPACPRFMWRVQEVPFGLDLPYWVEVEDLDLRKHVHRVGLPAPGGDQELAEVAGLLFERPLDRSRPLWEMYWIDGLSGGRKALLWKFHHAIMDGMSGAGLSELLFDLQPDAPPREVACADDDAWAGPPVDTATMLARAALNSVRRPLALARHLGLAARAALEGLRGRGRFQQATAPRTILNGSVGSRRGVAWSTVSLAEAKELKNALGVKLNDIALAISGGALRRYLEARDALPDEPLIAAVPVSTRQPGDRSLGNQITEVGMDWGTDVADPLERVRKVATLSAEAKRAAASDGLNLLAALGESLPPVSIEQFMRLAGAAAESMPLPANAVLSNVPFTPVPLYMAGARVESVVPISILAPTQRINLTVVSYCDELRFGLTYDPDGVSDAWEIVDAIPKELVALREAAARASVDTATA